jgi:hypothetical protein
MKNTLILILIFVFNTANATSEYTKESLLKTVVECNKLPFNYATKLQVILNDSGKQGAEQAVYQSTTPILIYGESTKSLLIDIGGRTFSAEFPSNAMQSLIKSIGMENRNGVWIKNKLNSNLTLNKWIDNTILLTCKHNA